jgi:Spy/CpxP family protein refolding chaperone
MRKLILSLAALSVMALATPLAANADPVVVVGHHHHWWHHDHDKTVIIKHDHN